MKKLLFSLLAVPLIFQSVFCMNQVIPKRLKIVELHLEPFSEQEDVRNLKSLREFYCKSFPDSYLEIATLQFVQRSSKGANVIASLLMNGTGEHNSIHLRFAQRMCDLQLKDSKFRQKYIKCMQREFITYVARGLYPDRSEFFESSVKAFPDIAKSNIKKLLEGCASYGNKRCFLFLVNYFKLDIKPLKDDLLSWCKIKDLNKVGPSIQDLCFELNKGREAIQQEIVRLTA